MQGAVVKALPAARRPAARYVLELAARRIPMRGIAKRSFLQAIDVARAAARRVGEELVASGRLEQRDDVFMLTGPELLGELTADGRAVVSERRALRERYQRLTFAATEWAGLPDLIEDGGPTAESAVDVITGTGVSSGVVEGPVRVVTDPSFADVEPDEVLVAPTTDPSWSSIMFISSALVVDLGGALSHAAVVARELRIPCVVNTRNGTRVLSTGDRVRVDGDAGTIEVLERAAPQTGG
jgi:pyruvate,water dikinase